MSCSHFQDYKVEHGLKLYKFIQSHFVFCKNADALKEKAQFIFCMECKVPKLKLLTCLHCVFFGCYSHMQNHASSHKHNFAIDVNYGTLFCFTCKNFIYSPELDTIIRKYRTRSLKSLGINIPYLPWEPDNVEIELIKEHTSRMSVTENSYIGLRGILNLGKTCYLNCIVQVLTHTPVLRDYFLSDRHVCLCGDQSSNCLMCEMSNLCQEFYTGKKTPFMPNHLLFLVWSHSFHLVGDKEQDAHEFFLEALNILHEDSKGITLNDRQGIESSKCDCIIDQVFSGVLQSNVECQICKNVSSAVEPFRDIGLGIGLPEDKRNKTTLEDCLRRFTMVENLANVNCKNCESAHPATKQLKIEKLPIIASFHLKRFEQKPDVFKKSNGAKRTKPSTKSQTPEVTFRSIKNTTEVIFPECIDLGQFTTCQPKNVPHFDFDSKYRLFAVVEHYGEEIETGHYFSYIRLCRDKWFQCNDTLLKAVKVEEVLKSQGYILFYHKNTLEYE